MMRNRLSKTSHSLVARFADFTAVFLGVAALATLAVAASPCAAQEPTADELLLGFDDMFRGTSSHGRMRLSVRTERWQRELTMEMWSQGPEKTLVRIVAPAKERGTSTLKVGKDIWNYLPKIDRTIRVPSSMMSGSWMGSHLTNDDLVSESRFVEDFECEISAAAKVESQEHWVIRCVPKPDAPIVWGEVVVTIRRQDELAEKIDYFDERGELVRSMIYDDVADIGGRRIPRRMRILPADKPQEYTEAYYDELEFDVELPASMFSLQSLRR